MPPKKTSQKINNKAASKSANKAATKKQNNNKNNSNNNATNGKKKESKIPEYVAVPENEDEVAISDEDLEFFAENKGFTSFLTGLDSKALSKNPVKQKEKKVTKKEPKKQEPEGLDSSDEELDNFEELDEEEEMALLNQQFEDESDEEEEQETVKKVQHTTKKELHESDEEMDYETKPRKVASEWTRKDYHNKLPIKLPGGKIHQREDDEEEQMSASEDEEKDQMSMESEEKQEEEEEEEEEEVKPKLSKKEYLLQKKEELATIANDIQGDPEDNIDQLKKLRSISQDNNVLVKKLALLTQLAVYKDIIPGYRIRPLTATEEEVQVSKEVKKTREYEKSLLTNYEMYLKDLNYLVSKKKTEEDASLALVATRCLCELLVSKIHFNFRLEIMVTVVTRMSTMKWNEAAQLCSEAIVTVFENDESGKSSFDAVKMIIRMVKSKGYAVNEKVINVFLRLRLKDEMAHSSVKSDEPEQVGKKRKNNNKPFLTKKAKKTLKETREIEKEFQEAEAIVSKEEKEKNHTETLKLIFAFYFRILKKQTSSPLLPAVLEGLSCFAHLINVDFFDDLLNALRDVMHAFEDSNDISRTSSGTRKRLLCIITAFELLSGQGEAFNYDLKDFYTEIYKILFKASFHTKIEEKPESQQQTESEMLIRGLELMFLKKRQIPINRLAAFIKRFALVALNMPNKTVLQCLGLVHRLVQKDHRLDALLQSEDRASSGIYAPLLEDPELCNPFGTSLYELFLYQNHYDPNVRAIAKNLQMTTQL
ncbi:nucleolar complex-associated protein-domain-containing protein [Gilbertella persicaria]|uniref:nucleolar complex-associated protein-domain-containing protein n=1 Tax=Gilbertella persicaria TaxID=101096 RepID=UPI00221F7ADB|nr:nucleolar complex-associated protein-domain-containing protein [Gilbertella persicaria]KAI8083260.1 nucleolar complex-associated protein-domain-containing protein [Gilbertella persicaria]